MFFNILLLVLILTLSFWIYKLQVQYRGSRYLRQIFDSPPGIPIFGNALEFFDCRSTVTDPYSKYLRLVENFSSKPFIIWIFHKPLFILTHHRDLQHSTHMLKKEPMFYKFIAEGIGNGLLTSDGERWKRSRRLMNPAFNTVTIINSYLPVFNKQSIKCIEKLKNEIGMGKTFDIGPYIFESAYASIYENTMGFDENMDDQIHSLPKTITKLEDFVYKRTISPWLYPWLAFKLYLHMEGSPNIFEENRNFYKKKIKEKRSMLNETATSKNTNAQERKPLIDILLETHSFNDQELIDEVITLLSTGTGTSAAAISFTLLMLAQHPDFQEKVYQELYKIFGDDLRFPQATDLSKMVFLEQCIQETLRKYCIAPGMARRATKDITLSDGRIIPVGSSIQFLFHPLHHNPEFYPDPDTWNPQNFHPESIAKRPPNTFMPFSSGARMCIGYKYAMVSIKAFLSTFIRHFKISTSQREITLKSGVITRSDNGYHIELTERQNNAEKIQE